MAGAGHFPARPGDVDGRAEASRAVLNEKQRLLSERFWADYVDAAVADFAQGIVVFSSDGVPVLVADAVAIGYLSRDNVWRWAWTTRWTRSDVRKQTAGLKHLGKEIGIPLLDRPCFAADERVVKLSVALACDRLGALGYCAFAKHGADGYVALTRIRRVVGTT